MYFSIWKSNRRGGPTKGDVKEVSEFKGKQGKYGVTIMKGKRFSRRKISNVFF